MQCCRMHHMNLQKSLYRQPLHHGQKLPLYLWDKLLPQATLTLNLMHGSQINLNLSTWAQVHDKL